MHIVHALFTHAPGGLGQAHVNTTEAFIARGHHVTALMHERSPYIPAVRGCGADICTINPTGFYDIRAMWKIRRLIKNLRPDTIIAHNARAITLLKTAAYGTGITVCGVTHSYKTARTMSADRLVVLSDHMRRHFLTAGYKKPIDTIPNLIRLPELYAPQPAHMPVVIGAIGRFTVEKGFDVFIKALNDLKQMNVAFTALIAGDGEESARLKKLAADCGLESYITWHGWAQDTEAFYHKIDILCIPSQEESFALVLLEGFAHAIPTVTTDTPGPLSIITDQENALVVPRGDHHNMALALQRLIHNAELRQKLAMSGWQRVQEFSFDSVAARWDALVRPTVL